MSASSSNTTATLDAEAIGKIANLSQLAFNENQAAEYAQSLNKILGLMQDLQSIDTTGIEPLKSPFDNPQPLRADVVTEPNLRDAYQAVAPATQDGLYLVPRVIENE